MRAVRCLVFLVAGVCQSMGWGMPYPQGAVVHSMIACGNPDADSDTGVHFVTETIAHALTVAATGERIVVQDTPAQSGGRQRLYSGQQALYGSAGIQVSPSGLSVSVPQLLTTNGTNTILVTLVGFKGSNGVAVYPECTEACVRSVLWDGVPNVASAFADSSGGRFVLSRVKSTITRVLLNVTLLEPRCAVADAWFHEEVVLPCTTPHKSPITPPLLVSRKGSINQPILRVVPRLDGA